MFGVVLRVVLVAAFVVSLVAPTTVLAANKAGAVTLTPMAGVHFFKDSEQLRNKNFYGGALGINLTEHVSFELAATGARVIDKTTPGHFRYYTGTANLLYHFNPEGAFVPYLALGGGITMIHPPQKKSMDEDALVNYGLGFKVFAGDALAFRVEGRHMLRHQVSLHPLDHGKNYGNYMVSGGLMLQLGGKAKEKAPIDSDNDGVIDAVDRCGMTAMGVPVDNYGCALDSDGDGVIDAVDQCYSTPMGDEVDSVGCSVEVVAAPATNAMLDNDEDGDGVMNDRDKCPNTPAGMPVNERGCLADSDHDGVFDIDDNCPQTPPGTRVGPDGCPDINAAPITENFGQMDELRLNIEFASNSSIIAPRYVDELERAAAFSKAHPEAVLMVEGHTDSTGSKAANAKLSQHRADTVRWILVRDYGVNAKKIKAKGYGESKPVASNDTQDGRKANRRVLVRLME